MNRDLNNRGEKNLNIRAVHTIFRIISPFFLILYLLITYFYLNSLGIHLNSNIERSIATLLGIDSHAGIPLIAKIVLAIFIYTFLMRGLFSHLKKYPLGVRNQIVIRRLYRFIFSSLSYILLLLLIQVLTLLAIGKTFASISNGTETLFYLIISTFSLSGLSGILLIVSIQGKFLSILQRIRISYFSAFFSAIILIFISRELYLSNPYLSHEEILYYLLPLSLVIMLIIGYFLRFKESDSDPVFLVNSGGPAVVMILLALILTDTGNLGLTSMNSPIAFFEYLFLWFPSLSLIVAISSATGYRMKWSKAKTALYSFSFLSGFIAVFIFLLFAGTFSSGPVVVYYSLTFLIRDIISLILISDLLKSSFLILLFLSTTYLVTKGLLSKIRNEILNMVSLLLSFVIIFFFFTEIIEKVSFFGGLFISGTLIFQNNGNIDWLPLIFSIIILLSLFVVAYILGGAASPGTRKGGMMASIIGIYFILTVYTPHFNSYHSSGIVYSASFLTVMMVAYAASVIATPARFSLLDETSRSRYKQYEESMISRGTNQYGALYGVNSESYSTLNIVGPENSGKTTFLAFFLNYIDSLSSDTKFTWDITSGIELMESLLNSIIVNGQFPDKNKNGKSNNISILLKPKEGSVFKNLTIVDWSGATLERDSEKSKGNLSNGKAYAVFIDQSLYSDLKNYDLKIVKILRDILDNRKKGLPDPRFCFVLFNFPVGTLDLEGQTPREVVMLLTETWKIIETRINSSTIYIRPTIKIKTDKEGKTSIESQEIDGILRIPYDPDTNYAFKLFFGWLLML